MMLVMYLKSFSYSLEWTSNELIFLIDNVIVYSFKNSPTYPFNQKFFNLNVAVGGNFVGNRVDTNFQRCYENWLRKGL